MDKKDVLEKVEIQNYDGDNRCLYIQIEDCGYSFSIESFPEDKHEWLKGVLSSHMKELYERTRRNQKREFQKAFKELIGL